MARVMDERDLHGSPILPCFLRHHTARVIVPLILDRVGSLQREANTRTLFYETRHECEIVENIVLRIAAVHELRRPQIFAVARSPAAALFDIEPGMPFRTALVI